MSKLITRQFWIDAGERAAKTGAQSMLLAIGQDAAGFDLFGADILNVIGFGAGGVVFSVLTSVASVKRTGTASAV